jgi:hypothetical protein
MRLLELEVHFFCFASINKLAGLGLVIMGNHTMKVPELSTTEKATLRLRFTLLHKCSPLIVSTSLLTVLVFHTD